MTHEVLSHHQLVVPYMVAVVEKFELICQDGLSIPAHEVGFVKQFVTRATASYNEGGLSHSAIGHIYSGIVFSKIE